MNLSVLTAAAGWLQNTKEVGLGIAIDIGVGSELFPFEKRTALFFSNPDYDCDPDPDSEPDRQLAGMDLASALGSI